MVNIKAILFAGVTSLALATTAHAASVVIGNLIITQSLSGNIMQDCIAFAA